MVEDSEYKRGCRGDSAHRKGLFITFEGGEGSGKSTQASNLASHLRSWGEREVLLTLEPGGTEAGRVLRDIVLSSIHRLGPRSAALLFLADRAHHVDRVIRPALERDAVVISDRYCDSAFAYQVGGWGIEPEVVRQMNNFATEGLLPDLTFVLDVPAETGLRRRRRTAGTKAGLDCIEMQEAAFHDRVREAYRGIADEEPGRVVLVDGTPPAQEVTHRVLDIARGRLGERLF